MLLSLDLLNLRSGGANPGLTVLTGANNANRVGPVVKKKALLTMSYNVEVYSVFNTYPEGTITHVHSLRFPVLFFLRFQSALLRLRRSYRDIHVKWKVLLFTFSFQE